MACFPAQTNYCLCTYTFSDYGACQPHGIQIRQIIGTPQPPGCIGVPQLWKPCTYTAPVAQCTQTITYAANAPDQAYLNKDATPGCDVAGLEIALSVALARLLQGF